ALAGRKFRSQSKSSRYAYPESPRKTGFRLTANYSAHAKKNTFRLNCRILSVAFCRELARKAKMNCVPHAQFQSMRDFKGNPKKTLRPRHASPGKSLIPSKTGPEPRGKPPRARRPPEKPSAA